MQFGASVSPATSGVELETRITTFLHRTQGASDLRKLEKEAERQAAAIATEEEVVDGGDEKGGGGGEVGGLAQRRKVQARAAAKAKAKRSMKASLSVAAAVRGEDRLTKRAETQAAKVRNNYTYSSVRTYT